MSIVHIARTCGRIRWIAARRQGEDVGIVGRTMFGIFLDVTGRKQAEASGAG